MDKVCQKTLIEELAVNDSKWRGYALAICKDKYIADDLVQDMYLKLCNYNKKIDCSYVYLTLKSIFLDNKRKEQEMVSVELIYNLSDTNIKYEVDDYELEILNNFKKIDWKQQQLIEESYYISLREIEKQFPLINYAYAHRQIKEGINKILNNVKKTEKS